jgi:glycosyltransferase involved in cell wall biosynthesis
VTLRPRIAQVITRLVVGGATVNTLYLCEALVDDYDVRVICGPDEGPEGSLRSEVESVAPVTVVPSLRRDIHPRQDVRAVRSLRRVYDDWRPDIVHTHSSKAGIVGRLAAQPDRCRVIHTIHGWGHTPLDPAWRRTGFVALERLAAGRTHALIAQSNDVRDEGLTLGIGRPAQYEVIPTGVDYQTRVSDFDAARDAARAELGLGDGPVMGWIGRFTPQKDPVTLVSTVRELASVRPDLRVVAVGDGPLREEAEREAERLGVASRMLFTGLRPDARSLYAAFDVVMQTSRWEGHPRVVQEAIAERVPVVATRAPGIGELVTPDIGYVAEQGDSSGLAKHVASVLDDPRFAPPLAREVVSAIASKNGKEVSLALQRSLIERLLAERGAGVGARDGR